MLVTYHGIVRRGKVEIAADNIPDGTRVVVVMQQTVSTIEEQQKRLAAMSQQEWEAPFKAYARLTAEYPAEVDIETISDEELNAIIHEVRNQV
ncbi:MAG: hypothetical protein IAE79_10405 [Anaerolinea sp.]|nr:hypothetical protein [Anaerolinea sp.]